ncbi:NADPH2:quinone reductase [Neomicrococcus aestuarii]|uniref:NADPH2:quinone reductase n=1 Tax=Neomicrococcus aestuarii TaxID=556325 RepID=A0A7W8TUA8_9MICC|nr:quinone oxidoreductase [Neomicrococcus aestuarii]MBB5511666.1 NADPH2:quinone reductase [Neomicrococcus aestuarii]
MKAIHVSQAGGPEVLEYVDVPEPTPAPGQVLIETVGTGVNFIETYERSGVYNISYPAIVGTEGAGRVVALGDGVKNLAVGARVATAQGVSTYAEYFVADAAHVVAVPDGVSDVEAAALPLQGMTAHYLINSSYPVKEGDVVLTYAGAGGVGLLLTQLLKMKGATVITTASTTEKRELAKGAGADYVLEYDDIPGTVREITNGRGADVVYDGIGKDTFDGSLASLRRRGMLVLFGGASGQVPPVNLQRFNAAGSLFFTRPTLKDYLLDAEEVEWRGHELFSLVASGKLDVRIGGQYPLSDAKKAHHDLESRGTTGKLVLVP